MARITAMQAAVLTKAAKKLKSKSEKEQEAQQLRTFLRETYSAIENVAKNGGYEIQKSISEIDWSVKKAAVLTLQEEGYTVLCFEVKEESICHNVGDSIMKIIWKS